MASDSGAGLVGLAQPSPPLSVGASLALRLARLPNFKKKRKATKLSLALPKARLILRYSKLILGYNIGVAIFFSWLYLP